MKLRFSRFLPQASTSNSTIASPWSIWLGSSSSKSFAISTGRKKGIRYRYRSIDSE